MHSGLSSSITKHYCDAIAVNKEMILTADSLATFGFCTVSLALVAIGLAIGTSNWVVDSEASTLNACCFTHEEKYIQQGSKLSAERQLQQVRCVV